MSTDADLIIVGGGPVGLAAAIEARLAGLSVALVEARDGAIDKACGEGLMPGAVPMLDHLGVHPAGMPLRGVSYRDGKHVADYRFRDGSGLGVRRLELHRALTDRADALGVRRVYEKVTELSQDATGVSVAGLRGSWLLGADGLHSSVRRLAGLEAAPGRLKRYGLRRHFAVEPWSDLIEVHWANGIEAYVTPVAPDVVGVAILGNKGLDFDDAIAGIPELAGHLTGATRASVLRGAGPLRQRATKPGSGRVLLVGDASGYVDAITGEGLRLGFEQARVAVAAIVAGEPQKYNAEWRRVTRDFRTLTSGLVTAARSPARAAIVPLAARLPGVYGSIVERLAR